MSDLRPKPLKIEIGGKEYGLLFNLNAIDEIQDALDLPISEVYKAMNDERRVFKVLKTMLAVMINEAINDAESGEEHVTPEFVGRKIKVSDIKSMKEKAYKAFTDGMPDAEDDDPNGESE